MIISQRMVRFNELKEYGNGIIANDQMAIVRIDGHSELEPYYLGDDSHLHLLVHNGSARIEFDDTSVTIGPQMLFDGVNRRYVKILSVSSTFRATALIFNREFITTLLNGHPVIPLEYLQNRQVNPCFQLSEQSEGRLAHAFGEAEDILSHPQSRYLPQMLDHAVTMLMMVIADCFQNDVKNKISSKGLSPRNRQMFLRFVDLLEKHVNTKHSVAFYASELCVSPQYLNRVVRKASGDNVMAWVSKMLTSNIAVALTDSDDTMQQLAIKFHFSDVATFTRYFKKNTGFSPSEYRNNQY